MTRLGRDLSQVIRLVKSTNCQYKSSNHRNLTRHFQIHTSNFQCSVCNKTFSNKGNLNRHQASAHESIPEGDGNLSSNDTILKDVKYGNDDDMEIDKFESSGLSGSSR